MLIRAAEPLDLAAARPIADPALDLAAPLKGPFRADPLPWRAEAEAAMELALIAGILPAFLVASEPAREAVTVSVEDQTLTLPDGTRAKFPIDPFARYCLLNGVDELEFLLSQEAAIAAFEVKRG